MNSGEEREKIHPKDLRYIINNPWSISESEWRLRDENSRETIFNHIQELLKLTEDQGYSNIWKTNANEPIAILGCYKVDEMRYTTFFICSHHYDQYAMKLSFQMRRILREKSRDYKGHTLGLSSSSEHPHLMTWLRFLGFKYVEEGDNGDWRYFEYVSQT